MGEVVFLRKIGNVKLEMRKSHVKALHGCVLAGCLFSAVTVLAEANHFVSPDGRVDAVVSVDAAGQLTYAVTFRGRQILAPSSIGLTRDGKDQGKVTSMRVLNAREVHERFPTKGVHVQGRYDAQVALFAVLPREGRAYGLQVSVADEGFAWRFLVSDKGAHRVDGETACFSLPPESRMWIGAPLSGVGAVSTLGSARSSPIVAELPDNFGFALVTETALFNYSGLRLEVRPDGGVSGGFAEKSGFATEGRFTTPWRVVLLAPTLDTLVNSDLVAALTPPPDPELFESMDWTEGGRSLLLRPSENAEWTSEAVLRRGIDCARRLKFEFATLDGGWETQTNAWRLLKEVCAYGLTNNVRVVVSKQGSELSQATNDYAALRGFLDRVSAAGAAGVRVCPEKGAVPGCFTFGERVLREAALRKVWVDFQGCRIPSGGNRTYPNEMTCEAVFGFSEGAPLVFSDAGETTWTHRLAVAYLLASPLLMMDEPPQRLFTEPQLADLPPFLETLPVAWDETRVLDGSRIGELAAFARRKGNVWYVAMANGTAELKMVSFAPLFTGWRYARLSQLTDVAGKKVDSVFSNRTIMGDAPLIVTLEPFGGFVAKLEKE